MLARRGRGNRERVIVVGVDGGTLDLVEPWAAEGKLPHFARLMAEGVSGRLRSVIQPITAPAWASFLTGKNPGKHGLFGFYRREEGSYHRVPVSGADINGETIGEILNRNGKRVALINIPETYPPRKVNGILVSGMESPGGSRYTYPPELQRELANMGYIVQVAEVYKPGAEERYLQRICEMTSRRARAAFWLMERHDWDLFVVIFRNTDMASHFLWRFMDPTYPGYDEKKAERYGDGILRCYQQIDGVLGEILERMDDFTTLMVMSDHGFGSTPKMFSLNNWLMREGLLQVRRSPISLLRYWLFKMGFTWQGILGLLSLLRLRNIPLRLSMGRRAGVARGLFSYSDIDWSRSKAYALGRIGQIFLNVKGREPGGCITPGEGYESTRERLIQQLSELRDPETGERIVERALRKEEVYVGEQVAKAPDIFVIWKEGYEDNCPIGRTNRLISSDFHHLSGGHRIDGMLIAAGRAIRRRATVSRAQIVDLAPTILHLLDLAIPMDMDGRVLEEILDPASFQGSPIRYEEGREGLPSPEAGWSPEEAEEIEARLRGLGYLG